MSTVYTRGDVSNLRRVLLIGHANDPRFNPKNARLEEWDGKNLLDMMSDYCQVWNPSVDQQKEHLLYLWTSYLNANKHLQCILVDAKGLAGETSRWPHVATVWIIRERIIEARAAEQLQQQLKNQISQENERKRSMMFRRVLVTGISGHIAIIPKSQHGGIPHLDKHIKLHKKNDPRYRWKVDECYFCENLTKARQQVSLLHNLPLPSDLSTTVHYSSVTSPHTRRCRLPSLRTGTTT